MKEILVVICGSRTFTYQDFMLLKLQELSKELQAKFLVRQGGAIGADFHARVLARTHREFLNLERTFKPNYGKYGRGAPLVRNIEMLETNPIPQLAIAFYDHMKTSGTQHTVKEAQKRNIKTYEYIYTK